MAGLALTSVAIIHLENMKNLVNISIECKPVEKLAHSKVVFCLNVHVDKNLDKDSNIKIDVQKKQWKNEKIKPTIKSG